jgi:hypothetical protein
MHESSYSTKTRNKWLTFQVGVIATLVVSPLQAQTWQLTSNSLNRCDGVACSGDGKIFYAICGDGEQTLFGSTNSGISWATNARSADKPVACSGDGSKILSGEFLSTNSGESFTANTYIASVLVAGAWSGDGNMLVVIGDGISISTNNGTSWMIPATTADKNWNVVALSADGRVIIAAQTGGPLWRSTNSGQAWAVTTLTNTYWTALACTADGSRIIAESSPPGIFVSEDTGKTWTFQSPTGHYLTKDSYFYSINSSADGSLLVASVTSQGGGPYIYISRDFGASWVMDNTPGYPEAIICSADGTLLLASSGGNVVTQNLPPPLTVVPSASQLTLSWPAPSTQYTLQQTSDLSDTSWLSVTNAITVTNYRNQVILAPPATGNAFYRLHGPN